MTSLYVKLIVRAIMNFPGSHEYSIIKNLLALPICQLDSLPKSIKIIYSTEFVPNSKIYFSLTISNDRIS